MTINVDETVAGEYVEKGYREVERYYYTNSAAPIVRISFADPESTCLREMRGWQAPFRYGHKTQHGYCLLDKGHKGRHSTVVFWCDACGKARRGEPAYRSEDVSVCWFCRNVDANRGNGQ